jgi:hypothetical protein
MAGRVVRPDQGRAEPWHWVPASRTTVTLRETAVLPQVLVVSPPNRYYPVTGELVGHLAGMGRKAALSQHGEPWH